jgi:hypothetical protein
MEFVIFTGAAKALHRSCTGFTIEEHRYYTGGREIFFSSTGESEEFRC